MTKINVVSAQKEGNLYKSLILKQLSKLFSVLMRMRVRIRTFGNQNGGACNVYGESNE